MKYALISDLHLDFFKEQAINLMINHINQNTTDVDCIINCGDTFESFIDRDEFNSKISKPIVTALGNHDFYRSNGRNDLHYLEDKKMVVATLWTNFAENDVVMGYSQRGISDFSEINFWSAEDMKKSYYETLEFIERFNPEIVVTHFGCHLNSIDPKYGDSMINPYFINDCSETISKVKPKVWCHGHTHSKFDYMVDSTRILCNPFGYPYENYSTIGDYPIVKFEI